MKRCVRVNFSFSDGTGYANLMDFVEVTTPGGHTVQKGTIVNKRPKWILSCLLSEIRRPK